MNKKLFITLIFTLALSSAFPGMLQAQVLENSLENSIERNETWLKEVRLNDLNFHQEDVLTEEISLRSTLLKKELEAYEFKYDSELSEHLRFNIKSSNFESLSLALKLGEYINEVNTLDREKSQGALSELVIYGPKLFDTFQNSSLSPELEEKRIEISESLFVISQGKKSLTTLKEMNEEQRILYLHHLQTQLDLLIIDLSHEQEEIIKKWSSEPAANGIQSRIERKVLVEEAVALQLKNLKQIESKLQN